MVIELTDGFYTLPDIVVSNLWILWIDRKRYNVTYHIGLSMKYLVLIVMTARHLRNFFRARYL